MPALAFLIIFSSISVALLLYTQHRQYLYNQFSANIAQARNDMHVLVQQQTSALSMSLKAVVNDPNVQRSLRQRDSDALLDQWQDVFRKMKLENRLTHLYFMDKNRVVLLRVHNPSKKGDIINRFTAQESEWSRKLSSGIEVGPMGMLTLRVVQPVIIDNELIGYVEMGKEIEDILQVLHLSEDIELAMVLRKDVIKRPGWEEGMRLMGREPNWKLFGNDVLIYSSLEHLPSAMLDHIDKDLAFRHIHENGSDEISAEGSTYRAAMIEFKDVAGSEVGDIFIFKNITNENIEFYNMIAIIVLVGGILVALMLGFVYRLLKKSDEKINNQQSSLLESEQRLEQLAVPSHGR